MTTCISVVCLVSFILLYPVATNTKEVRYDLTVAYFDGAPDGVPKRILGFNNQFPGPTIRATKNDILTIKITNLIRDFQTTTIHWHGLEQFLTPFQDGPRLLTQCDIVYNTSMTYQFELIQSGTYWYHSHHTGQYSEGLWGVMIIDNTPEVHAYDGEFLLTLSDWFHIPSKELSDWYSSSESKGGIPFPDSSLINGRGYYSCEYANRKNMSCNSSLEHKYPVLEVERGKTYRIRVVNSATMVLYAFSIDGHKLEVIETDGVDTVRVQGVDRVTVSTGTRYSFLVKMDGDGDQYWIRSSADLLPFKLDHPNINPFPQAHLEKVTTFAVLKYKTTTGTGRKSTDSRPLTNDGAVQGRPGEHDMNRLNEMKQSGYNLATKVIATETIDGNAASLLNDPINLPVASAPYPSTNEREGGGVRLNYMDCHPFGGEQAPSHVNETIILYVPHIDHPNNRVKLGFNNISYDSSTLDKPALIKVLNGEKLPPSLNPHFIGFGKDWIVELIVNDYGDSGHPFHLHGHTFWVMGYGIANDGPFNEQRHRQKLKSGIRKETMAVQPNSWLVIRFRADNPGVWIYHCHMNWHFEAALGLVFVEGVEMIKSLYRVPNETINVCKNAGMDISKKDGRNPSDTGLISIVNVVHKKVEIIFNLAKQFLNIFQFPFVGK